MDSNDGTTPPTAQEYDECKQRNAVWETEEVNKGILKVKAYNPEEVDIKPVPCISDASSYHHRKKSKCW